MPLESDDGSEASYEYLAKNETQTSVGHSAVDEAVWKEALSRLRTEIGNVTGVALELKQAALRAPETERAHPTELQSRYQSVERAERSFLWWIAGIFVAVLFAHCCTLYIANPPERRTILSATIRRELHQLLQENADLISEKGRLLEEKAAAEEKLAVLSRERTNQEKKLKELKKQNSNLSASHARCTAMVNETANSYVECEDSRDEILKKYGEQSNEYWRVYKENVWLNQTVIAAYMEQSWLRMENSGLEIDKVNLMTKLSEAERMTETLKKNALSCSDEKKRFQKALEMYGWTLGEYDYMERAVRKCCQRHCNC